MGRIRYWLDWLFKDLTERRGKYVIAEVPNWPLLLFMGGIIFGIIQNPGLVQKTLMVLSYAALGYWGWLERKGGRSRFRKLLGILGIIAAFGAAYLTLTY